MSCKTFNKQKKSQGFINPEFAIPRELDRINLKVKVSFVSLVPITICFCEVRFWVSVNPSSGTEFVEWKTQRQSRNGDVADERERGAGRFECALLIQVSSCSLLYFLVVPYNYITRLLQERSKTQILQKKYRTG